MTQKRNDDISALEMFFEPVCNRDIGAAFAYRSQLRINSPELGVLLPSVYLPIAERTLQASKLYTFALREAAAAVATLDKKGVYYNWVSVYIPLRLLTSDGFLEDALAVIDEAGIKPTQLCIELSGELLYADVAEFGIIEQLQSAGFKILLSDFGDDYCPIMKLNMFSFDYVLMNPTVTKRLCSKDEKTVSSAYFLVEMITELKSKPIATVVNTKKIDEAMPDILSLYCGKLAGKTRKLQNIRA